MRLSLLILLNLIFSVIFTQNSITASDDSEWWKRNNLRLIQCNLPAYEAADIDADSLVQDLMEFSANTLIINAGGIMAFYETELDFHYLNPHMKPGELSKVIDRCHARGIRVIVRFDFSRAHETIFKAHPEWFYISPNGERIINTDKYVVCINAPYVQEKAFKIIEEVIDRFDIDGIFLNMPGYQTRNPYEDKYHGIDQNDYDRDAFKQWSGGLDLPQKEDRTDPVFRKYEQFKRESIVVWSEKLHQVVKSKKKKIAICTYLEEFVDIIRHESQTHGLPYWPYTASDNTNHIEQSFPDKIVSNASIQQISFQSRFNAIEPEEISIRLYENLANGSGTDVSLMGDLREYEDQRNFEVMKKIYAHQKKWEPYFGKYASLAKVAVVAPGYWPGGDAMQEYRGIQLMLKEAHIQYDIIQHNQLATLKERLKNYSVLMLPDISNIALNDVQAIEEIADNRTLIFATNRSLVETPHTLEKLFGAKTINADFEGTGNYLHPNDKSFFTSFDGQSMVHFKFNLGLYDFSRADQFYLSILKKGRPGPPEMIGGHDPTGFFALGIKNKHILMPINIGKIYYLHGYEQHKQLVLDALAYQFANTFEQITTNAHPRIEIILQDYMLNEDGVTIHSPFISAGHIMHLVNLLGFSGNTYFEPPLVSNLAFKIKLDFAPSRVWTMQSEQDLPFHYTNGFLDFELDQLVDFEGIVIDR